MNDLEVALELETLRLKLLTGELQLMNPRIIDGQLIAFITGGKKLQLISIDIADKDDWHVHHLRHATAKRNAR